LIHSLCLSISLRVESGAVVKRRAQRTMQTSPELSCELRSSVEDNTTGDPM
jgi:hypothetical protein